MLILSALGAFFLQFPSTFLGRMINKGGEIPMEPAVQAKYWAVVFMPQQLKPLIALCIESTPAIAGKRFVPWLMFANIGIFTSTILIALAATEVWHLFILGTMQSLMESISYMVVYMLMLQIAAKDKSVISALNAEIMTARYIGTFFANVFALPVGGCFGGGWNNRLVIGVASTVPFLSIFVSTLYPEKASLEKPIKKARASFSKKAGIAYFVAIVLCFQALVVVLSLNSLFADLNLSNMWTWLVIVLAAIVFGLVLGALYLLHVIDGVKSSLVWSLGIPCIYLIVVDAVPSASMYSLQYTTISDQCAIVGLSVAGSITSMITPSLYSKVFGTFNVEVGLLVSTVFSALVGMLNMILANYWPETAPLYQWFLIGGIVNIAATMLNMAKEVVCTTFAFGLQESDTNSFARLSVDEEFEDLAIGDIDDPIESKSTFEKITPGVLFGIYISCFDVGASAAGFINAAVTDSLSITFDNFENLSLYVLIGSVSLMFTIVFLPALSAKKRN